MSNLKNLFEQSKGEAKSKCVKVGSLMLFLRQLVADLALSPPPPNSPPSSTTTAGKYFCTLYVTTLLSLLPLSAFSS